MAKNSRKHRKAPKLKVGLPIPLVPPGHKRTGELLYDLNERFGSAALDDAGIRARIRREYKGRVEIKQVGGKWRLSAVDASEATQPEM